MIARGGKAVYGAELGILMLEARFPRIPGDMGNALTWPFPVRYRVVRGASPDLAVRRGARGLLEKFVAAGRDLVADGCAGIATNCGFLSVFQTELSARLGVPVAASALMQVPLIAATLPPGRRVGVLTICAEALSPAHLAAAGVPPETPIAGVDPQGALATTILEDRETLDLAAARAEMIEAAGRLVAKNPDVGAIALECTNMVPWAADVARETGLPVHSIFDFMLWFHAALRPPRFSPPD